MNYKKKFFRAITLGYLDKEGVLFYKLKTGRLSVGLEFEIMEYLGTSKLIEAIGLLAENRNYLLDFPEEEVKKWLNNDKNKKILALNKVKSIIEKAYEKQYILQE